MGSPKPAHNASVEQKSIRPRKKDYFAPISFISGGIVIGNSERHPLDASATKSDFSDFGFGKLQLADGSAKDSVADSAELECSPTLANDPNKFGDWMKFGKADVVAKMMEKMGYKEGSGLGKAKQGIVDPVQPTIRTSRGGVGYDKETKVTNFGDRATDARKQSAVTNSSPSNSKSKQNQILSSGKKSVVTTLKRTPDDENSYSSGELTEFDLFWWFSFLQGRCPSTVADPITSSKFSTRAKAMRTKLCGAQGLLKLMQINNLKEPLLCFSCGVSTANIDQLFEHFLGQRHFDMVTSQNRVFSKSEDIGKLHELIKEARSKCIKPEPKINSEFSSWFPFLHGRCPSTVTDPISTAAQFTSLGEQLRTMLTKEKGLLHILPKKYRTFEEQVDCPACGAENIYLENIFMHFLGKRHFNKVMSQKKVFSVSQDFALLQEFFNKAKSEYMERKHLSEKDVSETVYPSSSPCRVNSSRSAEPRPNEATCTELSPWFPFLQGRCPSTVTDPISTVAPFLTLAQELRITLVGEEGLSHLMPEKYDSKKGPFSCSTCGLTATHSNTLFIHFLGKRHFNMVIKQKKVFSISEDFEKLHEFFEKARAEYRKCESKKKTLDESQPKVQYVSESMLIEAESNFTVKGVSETSPPREENCVHGKEQEANAPGNTESGLKTSLNKELFLSEDLENGQESFNEAAPKSCEPESNKKTNSVVPTQTSISFKTGSSNLCVIV